MPLTFTRRNRERIVCIHPDGSRIEFEIRIRGGRVQVSVTAPRTVQVDRGEVRRRKDVDIAPPEL
jgi:sRNA-binding carbon storage regulator CsrA